MGVSRVRGQEVEVRIVRDGGFLDTLTAIQSFEWTSRTSTLEADRLGGTTTEVDDIYHGASGRIQMHIESSSYLAFIESVRDRARRVTPVTFSIVETMTHPDGTVSRTLFPDVFFEEQSVNVGSRAAFVEFTIAFKCEDFRRLG